MTEPVTTGAPDPTLPLVPDETVTTTTTEHTDPATGDETVTVETDFYNIHKTKFGRPASNDGYLDELEAEQAEITRAAIEDREPDLENPPATAGQPLVPAEQLPETSLTTVASSVSHLQDDLGVAVDPSAVLPVAEDPEAVSETASDEVVASGANNTEPEIDTTHADQTADEDAARNDGITTPTNTAETSDQTTEQDAANVASAVGTPWADSTPVTPPVVEEAPEEVPSGVTIPPVAPVDPEAQGS